MSDYFDKYASQCAIECPKDRVEDFLKRFGVRPQDTGGEYIDEWSHAAVELMRQLQSELDEARKWKEEDPRMLREQIRVADAAYQFLHEEHQKLQSELNEAKKCADWNRWCINEIAKVEKQRDQWREVAQQLLKAMSIHGAARYNAIAAFEALKETK